MTAELGLSAMDFPLKQDAIPHPKKIHLSSLIFFCYIRPTLDALWRPFSRLLINCILHETAQSKCRLRNVNLFGKFFSAMEEQISRRKVGQLCESVCVGETWNGGEGGRAVSQYKTGRYAGILCLPPSSARYHPPPDTLMATPSTASSRYDISNNIHLGRC